MRANTIVRDANSAIEQDLLTKVANFIVHGNRWKIEQTVSTHGEGQACRLVQQINGGFNYCLRVCFEHDNVGWMLRFPKPGCAMQPLQKVQNELTVMHFVAQHTTIPVPRPIACASAQGKIAWLGPYLLIEYI